MNHAPLGSNQLQPTLNHLQLAALNAHLIEVQGSTAPLRYSSSKLTTLDVSLRPRSAGRARIAQ